MERDASQADAERTMVRLRERLSQPEVEVLLLFSVERVSEREIASADGDRGGAGAAGGGGSGVRGGALACRLGALAEPVHRGDAEDADNTRA